MSGWRELEAELDTWIRLDRMARFWWRDDDAVDHTPSLDRLIGLAQEHAVPITLAVIPARMERALVRRVAASPELITLVQHGFAHQNHAPQGEKRAELGADRPLAVVREELARGAVRMSAEVRSLALPVLVPPWNRLSAALVPELAEIGFTGLSLYQARRTLLPAAGLLQVDCHIDIMRWTRPPRFIGEAVAIELLLTHLRARRDGSGDSAKNTGLLSHHLVLDEEGWTFLARLLTLLRKHPAVRLDSASEVFTAGTG